MVATQVTTIRTKETKRESRKIAENQKADYVAFGPIYRTFSKRKKRIDIKKVFDSLKKLRLPFTLIGGINHSNFMELFKFKPHNIAIISSIWNFHKGPIESALIYNSIMKEGFTNEDKC